MPQDLPRDGRGVGSAAPVVDARRPVAGVDGELPWEWFADERRWSLVAGVVGGAVSPEAYGDLPPDVPDAEVEAFELSEPWEFAGAVELSARDGGEELRLGRLGGGGGVVAVPGTGTSRVAVARVLAEQLPDTLARCAMGWWTGGGRTIPLLPLGRFRCDQLKPPSSVRYADRERDDHQPVEIPRTRPCSFWSETET